MWYIPRNVFDNWDREEQEHVMCSLQLFNTLRPRQSGRHFADDTFKRIFMNENVRISIHISLKFVPKGLSKYLSIGSDNGLAPTRRQAITWTNDG